MIQLGKDLRTYVEGNPHLAFRSVGDVRRDPGLEVESYLELVKRVARISFFNPGYSMFFRGQDRDYKNRSGYTTLYPKIFRDDSLNMISRYEELRRKVDLIKDSYRFERKRIVTRDRYLLWAILQHYQACPTPLLDLTHSLSVACSFSFLDNNEKNPILYVLALPHLVGGVTVSHESQLLVIRLLSVCPPNAMRPYVQEAYVIGEYPPIDDFATKREYSIYEVNCAHRLLCKFRLNREGFLSDRHFKSMLEFHKKILFPNRQDEFYKFTRTFYKL